MIEKNKNFLSLLKSRQLVAQVSHEDELGQLMDEHAKGSLTKAPAIYCGMDPTAKSLHIGHLLQLRVMRYAQDCGLQPIILFGGATGLIGDPTGRTDMRKMNTVEDVESYIDNFKKLTKHYFRYNVENEPIFLNNYDWLGKMSWLDFARDVGVHFTVARLLSAEVNKVRFETGGLTFMELGYQLLQSYDFLHLYQKYNCVIQVGGNDQWSNVLGGADLIRRTVGGKAFALTTPLLVNAEGQKIGKTAGNAIWLDGSMTSPYEFFQYLRNLPDSLIATFMKTLGDFPLEDIDTLVQNINEAKEQMALRTTEWVHGPELAHKALETARAFFKGEGAPPGAPTTLISRPELLNLDILGLMVHCGLCSSRSEARKLILGGGFQMNNKKVLDPLSKINFEDFPSGEALLKKGKKDFHIVKLK